MTKIAKKSNLSEIFSKAASTNSGRVHVVPSKDGWAVKKEGAKRASVVKSTKSSAVKAANNLGNAVRIVVHKKDGTIQTNTKKK
jgi:uncharacterized protein YdaT